MRRVFSGSNSNPSRNIDRSHTSRSPSQYSRNLKPSHKRKRRRQRKIPRRLTTAICSGSPRSSVRCISCAAFAAPNEGQKWRNEAQTLIDTEAPSGERHDQMIASFNRGYRAFQQSYRTCTPAADFAIRRYLAEGAKIAREITARYAN